MAAEKPKDTLTHPFLKSRPIEIFPPEDKKQIDELPPILSCKFEVKVCEEVLEENGEIRRSGSLYLFYNDNLIRAFDGLDNFFKLQSKYILDNLELELINTASLIFNLSFLAAGINLNIAQKNLYRTLYQLISKDIASKQVLRRNLQLKIKSGRLKGSKNREIKYSKNELYTKLKTLITSYYEREGKAPSQEAIAKELNLGYAKRLQRLLDEYKETRHWRELVADILAMRK